MKPVKSRAAELICRAREHSGLSLREIARRAGTSHATLSAYLGGKKIPSTETLLRVVDACDVALDISLRPRIRERRGLARSEELEQALRLAEQFPKRPARRLIAPNFARAVHGHRR
jgi:transcriptional regulator with XRE-family HTH domain